MLHDVFFRMFNECIRLTVLALVMLPVRKLLKRVSARMSYFFWSILPVSVLVRVFLPVLRGQDAVMVGLQERSGLLFLPEILLYLLEAIWLIGLIVKLYDVVMPYIKLKRYLVGSICIDKNVYVSSRVMTPFSLGLLSPKIYLPAGLSKAYYPPVIMHEKIHITRKDLWVKAIAVSFTILFWFCPIWDKVCDACIEDMEAACDEAVIRKSSDAFKRQYAEALIMVSALPEDTGRLSLSYGREDIEERIGRVMGYGKISKESKRKAFLAFVASGMLFVAMMVVMPDVIARAEVAETGTEQNAEWEIYSRVIEISEKD